MGWARSYEPALDLDLAIDRCPLFSRLTIGSMSPTTWQLWSLSSNQNFDGSPEGCVLGHEQAVPILRCSRLKALPLRKMHNYLGKVCFYLW